VFRGKRVDFQIFIRQGDEPLPVRYLIDYHAEFGSPQFRANFSNWELSPQYANALFRLVPSAGAQRVEFREFVEILLGPLDVSGGDEQ